MTTSNNTTKTAPTMILTAGLPAAGKSTYLKSVGLDKHPTVDPDAIKETHPDYDPKNPQALHVWSKKLARKQHLSLLAEEKTFVVDGTGTNVEKYVQYINEARELGYNVELHYLVVDVQTSIERNAARERSVPTEIITEKAGVIEQTTAMIGSLCDAFHRVENK